MRLSSCVTKIFASCAILMGSTACNGIFEDIYDVPSENTKATEGQLIVNATSWTDWHYIDFKAIEALVKKGDKEALNHAQSNFISFPIPTEKEENASSSQSGIYTYWFDVWGKGLSVNEQKSFFATKKQEEPKEWSIAIHRNNVRTNNGAVLETNYTSFDQLPPNSTAFAGAKFQADEWSTNEVWVDQSQMVSSLIGCQGIYINKVLSSWLTIEIPPLPPAFFLNNHVFIIRFSDGSYAAVQLENYLNAVGTKCWLTINYKYPY